MPWFSHFSKRLGKTMSQTATIKHSGHLCLLCTCTPHCCDTEPTKEDVGLQQPGTLVHKDTLLYNVSTNSVARATQFNEVSEPTGRVAQMASTMTDSD